MALVASVESVRDSSGRRSKSRTVVRVSERMWRWKEATSEFVDGMNVDRVSSMEWRLSHGPSDASGSNHKRVVVPSSFRTIRF